MTNFKIIFLVVLLAILIVLLFALMFSYYFLLRRIAKHFPKYYKQLGSPFLPTASRAITKTIHRDPANYILLRALFIGTPNNFPKDTKLRHLALQIRLEMIAIVILLGISIGAVLAG